MRVAVLSDIHGNLPALEAVLEEVTRYGPDMLVLLGDHVTGPVDPAGTAERIMALDAVAIIGNHERWTVAPDHPKAGRIDHFARSQLSEHQLAWLGGLPATARLGDNIFLCHGTPSSDEEPWLDKFYDHRTATLPDLTEVAQHAEGVDAEVILCGHTHIARTVRLPDGRLIANPGSVGMQLIRGSPDAHYALLERGSRGWQVALMAVPYDTEAAARQAEANGFGGWGDLIRHGWAGPESMR